MTTNRCNRWRITAIVSAAVAAVLVASAALFFAGVVPQDFDAGAETEISTVGNISVGGTPKTMGVIGSDLFVGNQVSRTIEVIDTQTNRIVDTLPVNATALAVDSKKERVYAVDVENSLTIIDAKTRKVIDARGIGENPTAVAVNPETDLIYVADTGSNQVSVVDGTSFEVVAVIPVEGNPVSVAANSATNKTYVALWDSVVVIDGATNSTTEIPIPKPSTTLAVVESVNLVVITTLDDSAYVLSGNNNTLNPNPIKVGKRPQKLAVNEEALTAYVTNAGDHTLSAIDLTTNTVTATAVVGPNPDPVAVDPERKTVFVGNRGNDTVSVLKTTM